METSSCKTIEVDSSKSVENSQWKPKQPEIYAVYIEKLVKVYKQLTIWAEDFIKMNVQGELDMEKPLMKLQPDMT